MKYTSVLFAIATFCFATAMPINVAADSWPSWIGALPSMSAQAKKITTKQEESLVVIPASIPERFRPVQYKSLVPNVQEQKKPLNSLWWPSWIGRPNNY